MALKIYTHDINNFYSLEHCDSIVCYFGTVSRYSSAVQRHA